MFGKMEHGDMNAHDAERAETEQEAVEKWKIVDGDMREDGGLITYHVDAFRDGQKHAVPAEPPRAPEAQGELPASTTRVLTDDQIDDILIDGLGLHWLSEGTRTDGGVLARAVESAVAAALAAPAGEPVVYFQDAEGTMPARRVGDPVGLIRTRPSRPVKPQEPLTDEAVAQKFHEAYESLAPQFSYATRQESAVPWSAVPEKNKRLMIATVGTVRAALEHK